MGFHPVSCFRSLEVDKGFVDIDPGLCFSFWSLQILTQDQTLEFWVEVDLGVVAGPCSGSVIDLPDLCRIGEVVDVDSH